MTEIKLYNRDGANLKLVKTDTEVKPGIYVWKFDVDKNHSYIFQYCRMIYSDNDFKKIVSIDPSGGPFLSIGDILEDKYEIVKINNIYDIWISEANNNS